MKKLDHARYGLIAGGFGTIMGFAIMTAWWSWANGTTFNYFVQEVFIASSLYKDSILTVSVLFNVGLFWLSLRWEMERFAKGLLAVIFVSVPLIIWLQMGS